MPSVQLTANNVGVYNQFAEGAGGNDFNGSDYVNAKGEIFVKAISSSFQSNMSHNDRWYEIRLLKGFAAPQD